MDILKLIGRNELLFTDDFRINSKKLNKIVESSSFLVLGGGGSIGQALAKEVFKRNPKKLVILPKINTQ